MIVHVDYLGEQYLADLRSPLDISIPLRPNHVNPNCFYAPPPTTSPVIAGDFVGSIEKGGALNFLNLKLNPHGNGTHTECYAHIHDTKATINQTFSQFHFPAMVFSVYPEMLENGDRVLTMNSLRLLDEPDGESPLPPALIIRTLPNNDEKLQRNYSGTNPPYVDPQFLETIRKRGVRHFLIDLPSVDREQDEGKLVGHKAFWGIPDDIQTSNTITELIYVPSVIKDGLYLLQMSISPLELDVSPSKPIIYELKKK